MQDKIVIRGARTNNLKNISVDIPKEKLVVMTGISGSGKSSLAFDTIYAEGQRRYVESLSAYARQFLGQMEKPDVDYIDGLSPAISIDQKTTSHNPRSTVGTVTEIYDYLRLLWARVGTPHCPVCGREIKRQSLDQMADQVMKLPEGSRILVLAPVVRRQKGGHTKTLDDARRSGYARVRIDGEVRELSEEIELNKNAKHTIELVIDRLVVRAENGRRIADSLETALAAGGGAAEIIAADSSGASLSFSQNYACEDCGVSMEELTPRSFSFNNPSGACPTCAGIGALLKVDADLIMPNRELSVMDGAIVASGWGNVKGDHISKMYFEALARRYHFRLTQPLRELSDEAMNAILYGTNGEVLNLRYEREGSAGTLRQPFEGIINNLERRWRETQSSAMRAEIEQVMSESPCPDCRGKRLKKEALSVTVGGLNIMECCELSVAELGRFLDTLTLTERQMFIAESILKEIRSRISFLQNVGLEYLSLSRASGSLSGGESQRIRLATQIGSALTGVLYILDEPSIGLHQRDNDRLLATLKRLRDMGNSLIVVEHDEDTMRAADFIVDIGPGAGVNGGELVAAGTPDEIMRVERSVTGRYLSGAEKIPVPPRRRSGNGKKLELRGAAENNLKELDADIPLGCFVCVTGVSGSGKSSLVNEVLYTNLSARLNRVRVRPGRVRELRGLEFLDKVINIDQSPIGRTPRSNPATYTGVFSDIRELFASTQEARMRGYGQGRFSFNVKGGRCEACSGDGIIKIEMHFLPDVYVPCEVCKGRRYNRETLEVRYKGKNISDVLDMTVAEALRFFAEHERIAAKLQTLADVGLDYIRLGQPSTTLSGGEAQRIKLASELSRKATGSTLYILDEPTTGLHSADVHKLINVLSRLTDAGNTVVVIEHNLDLVKCADYIVDLGPEGGDAGGRLVCCGTPEQVAEHGESFTGQYLKRYLTDGGC